MKIEKVGNTLNIDAELFTVTQVGSVVKVDIQGLTIEKDVETGVYSINTIEPAKHLTSHTLIQNETEGVIVEPEDWIRWGSGDCPVEKGTLIDVKYLCGEVKYNIPALHPSDDVCADYCYWEHGGWPYDIIAYRLSKQRNHK